MRGLYQRLVVNAIHWRAHHALGEISALQGRQVFAVKGLCRGTEQGFAFRQATFE